MTRALKVTAQRDAIIRVLGSGGSHSVGPGLLIPVVELKGNKILLQRKGTKLTNPGALQTKQKWPLKIYYHIGLVLITAQRGLGEWTHPACYTYVCTNGQSKPLNWWSEVREQLSKHLPLRSRASASGGTVKEHSTSFHLHRDRALAMSLSQQRIGRTEQNQKNQPKETNQKKKKKYRMAFPILVPNNESLSHLLAVVYFLNQPYLWDLQYQHATDDTMNLWEHHYLSSMTRPALTF